MSSQFFYLYFFSLIHNRPLIIVSELQLCVQGNVVVKVKIQERENSMERKIGGN